jgi:hypothetical protein
MEFWGVCNMTKAIMICFFLFFFFIFFFFFFFFFFFLHGRLGFLMWC